MSSPTIDANIQRELSRLLLEIPSMEEPHFRDRLLLGVLTEEQIIDRTVLYANVAADIMSIVNTTTKLERLGTLIQNAKRLARDKQGLLNQLDKLLLKVGKVNGNRLGDLIAKHFEKAEIKILCFGLQINYDDISGNTRREKSIELVSFVERRSLTGDLLELCRKERPLANWNSVFD